MKRVLSLIFAMALLLSLVASAVAEDEVGIQGQTTDGQPITTSTVEGDSPTSDKYVLYVSGDDCTVDGNVTDVDDRGAIYSYASRVSVGKNVSEKLKGDAIIATNNSEVTVKGDVTEEGSDGNSAVYARTSSKVTVNGNVSGEGNTNIYDSAVRADDSTVNVGGNVTQKGSASAVYSTKKEVTVEGSVKGDAKGVYADNGTIKVGGDVTVSDDGAAAEENPEGGAAAGDDDVQYVYAVNALNGSTVLVEGTVTGEVIAKDVPSSKETQVYLGELNGTISSGSDLVHYLFALTEKSLTMDDLTVVGENTVLMDTSVEGVSKTYIPTYSAAQLASGTAAITIKPNQTGRELNFSGLPSTVKVTQNNGEYTLTLTSDFKGGLTAVQILLKEIAHDNPDSGAEVYINTDILPFVFVDNGYLIEAIEIKLPEEAEEGAVLPLEIPNHAGIKVAPSLLIPTVEYHMVQMFLNNAPVPENAFSITNHGDGSVSIQMSNTYLLSLGSGTYNFRALVDGQEIFFTVVVAKQEA